MACWVFCNNLIHLNDMFRIVHIIPSIRFHLWRWFCFPFVILASCQFCGFFSNKFFCSIYFLHCHFQLHGPQLLSFSLLLLRLVISDFSFSINMYAIISLGTVLTASHKFWFCILTSLCKLFNNEKLQPFFNITAQKHQHSNVFFIPLQSVSFRHLTFICSFFSADCYSFWLDYILVRTFWFF